MSDAVPEPNQSKGRSEGVRHDAEGLFAKSRAHPNPDGLSGAKPVVLSGDGDATFVNADDVRKSRRRGDPPFGELRVDPKE